MWERGIAGARSWAWACVSLLSSSEEGKSGDLASTGEVAVDIFWERITFVLCGDCGVLSRPAADEAALAWSAIVRSYYHFSSIQMVDGRWIGRRPIIVLQIVLWVRCGRGRRSTA